MATYKSAYSGPQIDEAIGRVLSGTTNGSSNRNLLDNWYFVGGGSQQGGGQFPVNQRGLTSYSGAVYGIDRWKVNLWNASTTLAVNSGNVTLTGTYTGANSCLLRQTLENGAQYAGKKVTASVLVGAVSGNRPRLWIGTNANERFAAMTLASNGLYQVTATLPNNITSLFLLIGQHASDGGSGNTSIEILAVKLELGDTQTLAHNEGTADAPAWVLNEIPNFAEELAKCQRYYQRIPVELNNAVCAGFAHDTTSFRAALPINVPMRSVPTATYTGTLVLNGNGTQLSVTAVGAHGTNVPYNVAVLIFTTSGATQRQTYILSATAANTYISLSADP